MMRLLFAAAVPSEADPNVVPEPFHQPVEMAGPAVLVQNCAFTISALIGILPPSVLPPFMSVAKFSVCVAPVSEIAPASADAANATPSPLGGVSIYPLPSKKGTGVVRLYFCPVACPDANRCKVNATATSFLLPKTA